jgi:hypothetical protein
MGEGQTVSKLRYALDSLLVVRSEGACETYERILNVGGICHVLINL